MRKGWKDNYHRLPEPLRKQVRQSYNSLSGIYYSLKGWFNRIFLKDYLISKHKKLHLGCGDIRLTNCVNIDYRATRATDMIMDLTHLHFFDDSSLSTVYSNAFFEHIYRQKRVDLLREIRRVLKDDGMAIFLAIPDFEYIARAYINKEPGIVGKTFDLFNVYRYTHGDPEQYPEWWFEQLHKSLFDKSEVTMLLDESGFSHYIVFRYIFDQEEISISLGFIAGKKGFDSHICKEKIDDLISQFTSKVNIKSLEILAVK